MQAFQSTWHGRSTAEPFDYLRMTTPNDNPGKLSLEINIQTSLPTCFS